MKGQFLEKPGVPTMERGSIQVTAAVALRTFKVVELSAAAPLLQAHPAPARAHPAPSRAPQFIPTLPKLQEEPEVRETSTSGLAPPDLMLRPIPYALTPLLNAVIPAQNPKQ